MARRSVWTGSISFGLVSIGVKALTAVHDHDVHFHQLERRTGARIGNQKISKESGDPVDSDDIEMGYEISKGRYVTFDPSEIDELRPSSTRTIHVSDFVQLEDIDPVYYERTYWLAPTDEGAEQAYRLLAAAMEDAQQVGIGTVVMRNKQYLTAIRPLKGALAMSTMRFADEVVDIEDVDEIPTGRTSASKKELALANQIIEALAADWDPARYEDTFTDELKSLIEAKERGDEIVAEAEEEPEGGKVLDLMAALQASVDAARSGRSSSSTKDAPARKATKRATSKKAPAKKAAAKKTTPAKKKAPARKKASARKKAPAKKAAAKKTAATRKSA